MQCSTDVDFAEQMQARGAAYALMGRLLLHEVSPELLRHLRQFFGVQNPAKTAGEALLGSFFAGTAAETEERVLSALATEYAGLFLNAGTRPVYPYESYYRGTERLLMQAPRDEVRRFYAESGFALSAQSREPEDHLGYEMELMSRFCAEAGAFCASLNHSALQQIHQRQRTFLEQHVLPWAPAFCQDLIQAATTEFYRGLGCLMRDFLELERVWCMEGFPNDSVRP